VGSAHVTGVRRWLSAARHPVRRDGVIAAALLVLPWALVWALAPENHLNAIAVAILASVTIPLAGLWLTWAAFRNASRSGSADSAAARKIITAKPGPIITDRENAAADPVLFQERQGPTANEREGIQNNGVTSLANVTSLPAGSDFYSTVASLIELFRSLKKPPSFRSRGVAATVFGWKIDMTGWIHDAELVLEEAYRLAKSREREGFPSVELAQATESAQADLQKMRDLIRQPEEAVDGHFVARTSEDILASISKVMELAVNF
jgi:hypothetical protein